MGLRLLIVFALVGQVSFARRHVELPPLSVETNHGGVVSGVACRTSNSIYTTTNNFGDGVSSTFHIFRFHFKSQSAEDQQVTVRLLKGSTCGVRDSNGGAPAPNRTGTSETVNADKTYLLDVPAYEGKSLDITARGNGRNCGFFLPGGFVYGTNVANCSGTPSSCMGQATVLKAAIEVTPEDGTVTGMISTIAHRCNGITDSFVEGPINLPILGGRAF